MSPRGDNGDGSTMPSVTMPARQTAAFYVQAAISFGVASCAVLIGVAYLPVDGWVRAFLALGVLYVVTSTFTLAKCVRDAHESARTLSRVVEARLERLLTEHDPLAS